MTKMYSIEERISHVPEPVFDAKPELIELYYKAWELAAQHVKYIPGMPQEIYMDEAFCHTNIWIWDTCFMTLFCKYAPDFFPGVESLHNFYDVMYGSAQYPEVTVPQEEPMWACNNTPPGQKMRLRLHIADNPPLLAWAEYQNALFIGDRAHLKKLLLEEQYLQKHYEWLENLKSVFTADWLVAESCWIKHEKGYSWEGGRSGMDNSPRGRSGDHAEKERPATPDLLWLDAVAQQGLAAECIARMFKIIGEKESAAEWDLKAAEKAKLLHDLYWDSNDRIFYDRSQAKNDFCKVPTIASYWPLTSGAADRDQAQNMADKLMDPDYFGGDIPFTSLARKDADFRKEGGAYWRGGVWIPTAYAAFRGLLRYGFYDISRKQVLKLLNRMYAVYKTVEPHTIWECYDPGRVAQGRQTNNTDFCRKDFCGWSAAAPISMFIESAIGIYSVNAFENKVCWSLDTKSPGRTGIRHLRFGKVKTNMIACNGMIDIETNEPFQLEINGKNYSICEGKQRFVL